VRIAGQSIVGVWVIFFGARLAVALQLLAR